MRARSDPLFYLKKKKSNKNPPDRQTVDPSEDAIEFPESMMVINVPVWGIISVPYGDVSS